MKQSDFDFDEVANRSIGLRIAGVDEAGRGPLIGSVVAAAVILDPSQPILGLNDSKKLTAKKREQLFAEIQHKALAYCIAEATHQEIDELNILQATMLAMQRAVAGLAIQADLVRIDGNRCPSLPIQCEAVVGGDALHAEISAASILAKVSRDRQMQALAQRYPQYGFEKHNGYPTQVHLQAIEQYGVLPEHRRSYKPIKLALQRIATGDQVE